jgi:hypothetical protein
MASFDFLPMLLLQKRERLRQCRWGVLAWLLLHQLLPL